MSAAELLDMIGRLLLQGRLHLLWHDIAAEHPSEHITDGTLQATLEP